MSNLKEVYHEFKERFPDHKISFLKFAKMRPKICVLAVGSGTHSACMCTIYTPECEVDVIGSGGAKEV